MNKAIVRMGSLLLLLPLLTGCGKGQAKAAPTAAPAEAPVITAAPDPVPVADAPWRLADVRSAVATLRVHLLPSSGEDGLRKMQGARRRRHCILTVRFLV